MLNPKLSTLLTAAELGSFTRAANALSLTQPAVSHHIKELEQQLGVTLFLRKKGQIQLTAAGEIVVQILRPPPHPPSRRHHAHGGEQPDYRSTREIWPGK